MNNANNSVTFTADRHIILPSGLTFKLASEDEVFPGYCVFNKRFDRADRLKDMPDGFLPLCTFYPKSVVPDTSRLVAVQTNLAKNVLFAASTGYTSAETMDFYLKKHKNILPRTTQEKEIIEKMELVLPFLSKITGYAEYKPNLQIMATEALPEKENAPQSPATSTVPERPVENPPVSAFKQTHEADMPQLLALISKAIDGRSIRGFALECGIVQSTLRYLVTGKASGPAKMELLKKIADHASPTSCVTLEMLANANGYTLGKTRKKAAAKAAGKRNAAETAPKAPDVTPKEPPKAPVDTIPAPAAPGTTMITKSVCFNVYEQIRHSGHDGYWTEERYVCSFEEEADANEFAQTNSCEVTYCRIPLLTRGTYVVRPAFYVNHAIYSKDMNPQSLLASATVPKIAAPEKIGYGIFINNNCKTILPGAPHIERIDSVKLFRNDYAAAQKAEADGIPIIHDMDGVEDWTYIDTPENRVLIASILHKYPECDTRNWRKRSEN